MTDTIRMISSHGSDICPNQRGGELVVDESGNKAESSRWKTSWNSSN